MPFSVENSFLAILLAVLISRKPVQRRGIGEKCGRGTQRQFSEKYLFGRRFEIYNFRNICCKSSCLPASLSIFEHLKNGTIAHF